MLRIIVVSLLALLGWSNAAIAFDPKTIDAMVLDGTLGNAGGLAALEDIDAVSLPGFGFSENDQHSDYLFPRINMLVHEKALNIYVMPRLKLRELASDRLNGKDCGCFALTQNGIRIVLCADEYLSNISARTSMLFEGEPAQQQRLRDAIVAWIISHEAGHHHANDPRLDGGGLSGNETLSLEREADAYAAQVFANTPMRTAFLEAVFGHSEPRPKRSDWLVQALAALQGLGQFGNSHPEFDARLAALATAVADMYADGRPYRDLRPILPAMPSIDACANAAPFALFDAATLVRQYWRYGLEERGRLAPLLARVRQDHAGTLDATTLGDLDFQVCQSAALARTRDECPSLGSPSAPFNTITRLQWQLARAPANDDQLVELLDVWWLFTEAFMQRFDPGDHYADFHYMSWMTLDRFPEDCGEEGMNLAAGAVVDCSRYAASAEQEFIMNNEQDMLLLTNTMLAFQPEDDRQRRTLLYLFAIYSAQHFKLSTQPPLMDLLDETAEATVLVGQHQQIATVALIYYRLGLVSRAEDLLLKVRPMIAEVFADEPYFAIIELGQFGSLCAANFLVTCGIAFYDDALAILSEEALAQTASAQELPVLRAYRGDFEFEQARLAILNDQTDAALIALERLLADPENTAADRIGILETIAEAHIWNGDGTAALALLDEARALFAQDKNRDSSNELSSLTYEVAARYLVGDWQAARIALDELDRNYEATFSFAMTGTPSPFAINRGFIKALDIKEEIYRNAGL